jgi:hypothetical protein
MWGLDRPSHRQEVIAMKLIHRMFGLALLLAAVATSASGCVFVPVGPGYVYRPVAPAPVVVAPAPVVVVRRPYYGYWW